MAKAEVTRFIEEIKTRFPEVTALMKKHESWAFTSLMEEFANLTTTKLNTGNLEDAQRYLLYMSEKLKVATPTEHEYIDVYYVEHLFWQGTQQGIANGWPLLPENLKALYLDFHGKPPNAKR
ncbi:DUF7674 family protein [Pseudoalteromonas sp. T1lg23B]|uniref:DUF7674 family protein n=1 Tax=Pseudoalteromonas sp. T1lg23B TaxID=2077097 RepID=UPI000CF70D10|nr:hypothetical protein [Pseudoalteromonas sp. T1lg23B]